jgi:hypothetical protein
LSVLLEEVGGDSYGSTFGAGTGFDRDGDSGNNPGHGNDEDENNLIP